MSKAAAIEHGDEGHVDYDISRHGAGTKLFGAIVFRPRWPRQGND